MNVPRQVRIVLATVFVGGLLATLVSGLIWAYTPVGDGGLTFLPDQIPLEDREGHAPAEPAPEPGAEGSPDDGEPAPPPDGAGANEAEDNEADEAEAQAQLVADAAEPAQTSVQVLDAGGGSAATRSAADVLRELGYRITYVTSARARVERTTVWFTSGNEPEALALRARDGRFAEVTANQGLNEATNLHVLVGPDWQH